MPPMKQDLPIKRTRRPKPAAFRIDPCLRDGWEMALSDAIETITLNPPHSDQTIHEKYCKLRAT